MVKSKRILIMADENKEMPVLGEMIANFPVEELKKAMLHIDRFDEDVVTEEKPNRQKLKKSWKKSRRK